MNQHDGPGQRPAKPSPGPEMGQPGGDARGERDSTQLHLFEGYGVEIETMLVHADSLGVLPSSDEVLLAVAGAYESEVEMGQLAWSNELVLHVIELKTNGPAASLAGLAEAFERDQARLRELLGPLGGRLMPTAMHPLMDPHSETRLWPHEYGEVYATFDRIFGCQGHGWSNLQSVHLNLPFTGDDELGRLHAAIRVALPILPALAASSPVVEGRVTGLSDSRLEFYRNNCRRLPSVTGRVIPEPWFTRADYVREILDPIARDVAPHDAAGVLEAEWVNARGAIARFERDTIEIRTLDVQECARADLAVVAAVVGVVRGLVEERWCSLQAQQAFGVDSLEPIFLDCMRQGGAALVGGDYTRALGLGPGQRSGRELWASLVDRLVGEGLLEARPEWTHPLEVITSRGTLSERIVEALGASPTRAQVVDTYRRLCDCLDRGQMFP